jgi:exodeoxyribonuclease III
MTWNILFGGQERWPAILALLGRERPDLLVLQECLGWEDGVRLAEAARAIDVEHVFLAHARPRGSGSRYHVALLSRAPITRRAVHNDPQRLGHCIGEIDVSVGGQTVTVLGTHFDSHNEDLRLAEAAYVGERPVLDRPALLAGDLNALRRGDPYPADLAERVSAAGIDKYGHPPRFDTMDALEAQGWIDTLVARTDPAAWPTARRGREGASVDFRTDYVLASPSLRARLVGAQVVAAEGASDHDAVLARFER